VVKSDFRAGEFFVVVLTWKKSIILQIAINTSVRRRKQRYSTESLRIGRQDSEKDGMGGKRKVLAEQGGRRKKSTAQKRLDRLATECSGNMAGVEAGEQLDLEVAIRVSAKEVAPPESRHAAELQRLIGPALRKPKPPLRINQQYARFLWEEDSEAEDEGGEQRMDAEGMDLTFFPTPSLKVIKEKQGVLNQQEEEADVNWHKMTTGVVNNAARSRPKGTWTTYEDKQRVYRVSHRIVEIDNSIGVEKPGKRPESVTERKILNFLVTSIVPQGIKVGPRKGEPLSVSYLKGWVTALLDLWQVRSPRSVATVCTARRR